MTTQPGDVTVINTLSIKNDANAPLARGGSISDAWINSPDHTTRDALPSAVTTLGTLVRTLNDGIVWEVTSVGPVVYTAWSGSGGVTSWNSRVGAVVPLASDYAASQVVNDSSVTGAFVKDALNSIRTSLLALVTGVSSVFGRAGAVVAAAGDYLASQVTNDSATVAGAHVSDALDALKAAVNAGLVFQLISNLVAYNASALPNGAVAALVQPLGFYELLLAPSSAVIAATDGVTIVQPTTPNTARWVQKGLSYSYVADWYVDGTAGDDANSGLVGFPLKTLSALASRLCPNGAYRTIKQDTNVHVAAGTYTENPVWRIAGPFTFHFIYATSVSANITLSAVTNTLPGLTTVGSGTRGQIATASGTFAQYQQLRCVSGSHVGACAHVTKLGADAQHAFVTDWHTLHNPSFALDRVDLAIGDQVVVETSLVDIVGIPTYETAGGAAILVELLGTSPTATNSFNSRWGSYTAIRFYRCQGVFNLTLCQATFMGCQGGWIQANTCYLVFFGNHHTRNCALLNCVTEGGGGDKFTNASLSMDGGTFTQGITLVIVGSTYGMNFEDLGSTALAINLAFGAQFLVFTEHAIWGTASGSTLTAINIGAGSRFTQFQAQRPTLAGVTQVSLAGKAFTYAQMPQSSANDAANYLVANGAGGNVSSDAVVPLSTKTALVAATNLYAANPGAGQFRISSVLTVKVAGGGGNFASFITWTDDTGVVQKRRVTAYLSTLAVDNADGVIVIRTNGTSQILYSIEGDQNFVLGTLQYEHSLQCQKESVP